MNEQQIKTKARKATDVVISGYKASYAHLLPHGSRDQWGFGGRTLCGATHRSGRWQGVDSPEERAEADAANLCPRCVTAALYQGMLDV